MQTFVKIGHTRYDFLPFLIWPAAAMLDFQILKFLVYVRLKMTNDNLYSPRMVITKNTYNIQLTKL